MQHLQRACRGLVGYSKQAYNPCNQKYYEPDSYCLDPYWLPSVVYPTIKYDGGVFVSLHQDDTAVISKPYPPGT
jgi:hypothetical protein